MPSGWEESGEFVTNVIICDESSLFLPIFFVIFHFPPRLSCYMRCSAQSCPTLCDPMNYSPLGSCVPEISQARIWSGMPSPAPEAFPDSGIKAASLVSPTLAGGFFTTAPPGKSRFSCTLPVKLVLRALIPSNADKSRSKGGEVCLINKTIAPQVGLSWFIWVLGAATAAF